MQLVVPLVVRRREALVAAAGAEGEHEVGEGAEEGSEEEGDGHHGDQRDEVEPVRQLLPHRARHEPLLRQHLPRIDKQQDVLRYRYSTESLYQPKGIHI